VYLTNDNPRNENPIEIINDILKGIKSNNVIIEIDRQKAIETAISNLKEDDILLVLGKGHEEYQIIDNKKIHFSDKEVILRCLEK
jgi:UDP-N-acetylmuramoyl-L-alanyl-D-glutamate--2,6-diaminopimelate ligase